MLYKGAGDQSAVVTGRDREQGLVPNDVLWNLVVGRDMLWEGLVDAC